MDSTFPHSADVTQGNVMVGGKPVCDDNWGMEEVEMQTLQEKLSMLLNVRQQWCAER